jgi:ABC-type dipeptide/oligopeptide/nickel transport system permease component
MGGFLFTSLMVVVGSLATDIVYVYLDPRVVYK